MTTDETKTAKPTLKQRVYRQFGKPTGFWGGLAGRIMAHRSSNVVRNRWTVELLELEPDDCVLEIGFGPGIALEAIAHTVTAGRIFGLDHSEVMLAQASKRNAAALQDNRLSLAIGSVEEDAQLPDEIDKILAVNVVQFWRQPVETLSRLRAALRPGGQIALTYQPRQSGATDEDAHDKGRQLVANLEEAGFASIRLEVRALKPAAVCAIGERPVASNNTV